MVLALKILAVLLAAVNGILPLFVDFKDESKRLTRWGRTAISLGTLSVFATILGTAIESRSNQRSTAESIDRQTTVIRKLAGLQEAAGQSIQKQTQMIGGLGKLQAAAGENVQKQTKVIDNLRQLVSPLDERLRLSLGFSVSALEPDVAGLAKRLESLGLPTWFVHVPRLTSADPYEGALASFMDSELFVYYCKSLACLSTFSTGSYKVGDPSQIDLSVRIVNHRPSALDSQPHETVVDGLNYFEGERGVLYEKPDKKFTLVFRNRPQPFSQSGDRMRSADDLVSCN